MSTYVDGFVVPLAKEQLENYRKIAELAADVWMEYGALEYRECVGDSLQVDGMVSFTDLAKIGHDELVIFSWITYESKEERDRINALVMADPRLKETFEGEMPFDCSRMSCGGFRTIVSR